MGARQTGHLGVKVSTLIVADGDEPADFARSPAGTWCVARCIEALTAVNKHSPQHTCPQGVIVA